MKLSTHITNTKSNSHTGHFKKFVKYKKRLLLRCIHHFKSDLINNMVHMRIAGIKPSSVILSQRRKLKKVKNIAKKYRKKLKPQGMV